VIATVTNRAGKLVEYTEEWFAQDRAGNVWYFGEDTYKIENGNKNREGSFEAGVDGAEPGVQMPTHPRRGWFSGWRVATRPAPPTTRRS
jgi:hypothetical protein